MQVVQCLTVFVLLTGSFGVALGVRKEATAGSKSDSETVITTFHVKEGKEVEMSRLIHRAWRTYYEQGMVLSQPNLVLQGTDDARKPFFIEILSWKNHEAPDNAPKVVKAIWAQMEAICEPRNGHRGIEFREMWIQTDALGTTRCKSTHR